MDSLGGSTIIVPAQRDIRHKESFSRTVNEPEVSHQESVTNRSGEGG
jgi:hypothetical protein